MSLLFFCFFFFRFFNVLPSKGVVGIGAAVCIQHIGRLRKSGGQKIEIISILLDRNLAYLYLLPIRTRAKKSRIFELSNKKMSDQFHVRKSI